MRQKKSRRSAVSFTLDKEKEKVCIGVMRLRKCYALIFVALIGFLCLADLNFIRQSQVYLQSFNQEIPAGPSMSQGKNYY